MNQKELQRWARLESYARAYRAAPTPSEARLWAALRGGALGVVFRRQVVIAGYIADFASHGARVVVEVDGSAHEGRRAADARKDAALRRAGWRVVRVTDAEVMRELGRVVERVSGAV